MKIFFRSSFKYFIQFVFTVLSVLFAFYLHKYSNNAEPYIIIHSLSEKYSSVAGNEIKGNYDLLFDLRKNIFTGKTPDYIKAVYTSKELLDEAEYVNYLIKVRQRLVHTIDTFNDIDNIVKKLVDHLVSDNQIIFKEEWAKNSKFLGKFFSFLCSEDKIHYTNMIELNSIKQCLVEKKLYKFLSKEISPKENYNLINLNSCFENKNVYYGIDNRSLGLKLDNQEVIHFPYLKLSKENKFLQTIIAFANYEKTDLKSLCNCYLNEITFAKNTISDLVKRINTELSKFKKISISGVITNPSEFSISVFNDFDLIPNLKEHKFETEKGIQSIFKYENPSIRFICNSNEKAKLLTIASGENVFFDAEMATLLNETTNYKYIYEAFKSSQRSAFIKIKYFSLGSKEPKKIKSNSFAFCKRK